MERITVPLKIGELSDGAIELLRHSDLPGEKMTRADLALYNLLAAESVRRAIPSPGEEAPVVIDLVLPPMDRHECLACGLLLFARLERLSKQLAGAVADGDHARSMDLFEAARLIIAVERPLRAVAVRQFAKRGKLRRLLIAVTGGKK